MFRAHREINSSADSELPECVVRWVKGISTPALPLTTVPGTTEDERHALAALGGLAGALAGERTVTWPKPMREWASGKQPPDGVVRRVESALEADAAFLARIYETLVAGRSRRRLGTFFTPPSVVEFMLDRAEAVGGEPAVVVDPGAGVGAFSLAARKRWPKARVIAVDVNLVTLGLFAVAEDAASVDLELGDFLRYVARGLPSEAPRLWIGNPPYTRHHDLATDVKEGARAAYEGLIWSRRAGLSSYFLAATLLNRRNTDTIAYLLPGTWLDTSYGEPLRSSVMTSGAAEIEMHGFDTGADLFPGTRVAAMALVLGPDGAKTRLSAGTAHLTGAGVQSAAKHTGALTPGRRLGIHVWPRDRALVPGGVQLGDLARVRRGVATGGNRYFFLTSADAEGFPTALLHRAILRLRGVKQFALTQSEHEVLRQRGDRVWLLRIGAGDAADEKVKEWIKVAERDGIHKRFLCASRKPWYALGSIIPPHVLVSPMTNGKFKAVTNPIQAIPSNALYGLHLEDAALAVPLVRWLNGTSGQTAMAAAARTYGSGLLKLEPSDLSSISVPAIDDLLEANSREDAVMEAHAHELQAIS